MKFRRNGLLLHFCPLLCTQLSALPLSVFIRPSAGLLRSVLSRSICAFSLLFHPVLLILKVEGVGVERTPWTESIPLQRKADRGDPCF